MEKEMISISRSKLEPSKASTQNLYLDKDFVLWPCFTLIDEEKIKQLRKYNIRRIYTQDQGEFLNENTLALRLELYAQNQKKPSLINNEEEDTAFWQIYETYFSFVEKMVGHFRKTGQINEQDLSQPYTTFSWKLKESNLGVEVLDSIRELAFSDPNRFHIHIILAITTLSTLQGFALDMDPSDLRELAFASAIATLGLFLLPLNQKNLFSPSGFLTHGFTSEEEKTYETYPILSQKIALKNQFNTTVSDLVLTHREMLNQKGFPYRPPSFRVSHSAQIIGISYKLSQFFFSSLEKESLYQCFLRLYRSLGDAYDRNLLSNSLDLIIPYKPQNVVELANGSFARVVKINNKYPKKPFLTLDLKSKEPKEADLFIAGESSETAIKKVLSESEAKLL